MNSGIGIQIYLSFMEILHVYRECKYWNNVGLYIKKSMPYVNAEILVFAQRLREWGGAGFGIMALHLTQVIRKATICRSN